MGKRVDVSTVARVELMAPSLPRLERAVDAVLEAYDEYMESDVIDGLAEAMGKLREARRS